MQRQLEKSFAGAHQVAQRYPRYASKITAAAKSAFLSGDQRAYALLARYHAEDRR